MAIKTIIIPVMSTMRHRDVIVLLRNDDVAFPIQLQFQGFVLLVAGVTVQAGYIAARLDQVRRRYPCRSGADEIRIHQGDRRPFVDVSGDIKTKRRTHRQENQAQETQYQIAFTRGIHLQCIFFTSITNISPTFLAEVLAFLAFTKLKYD
jgi:hypothetical protein